MSEVSIREFDLNQMGNTSVSLFIGKRNTGITTLLLDNLNKNRDISMVRCVSSTDEFNHLSDKYPDFIIHKEYTSKILEELIDHQKVILQSEFCQKYKDIKHRALLIIDGCLNDWLKDKNIEYIFMNGRHLGISCLLSMEYLGIPPILRCNSDYIFICMEADSNVKMKLYEKYAGIFPTYGMFNKVLTDSTKDHGCLVIDNVTLSDKLEDRVFCFKAKKPWLEVR